MGMSGKAEASRSGVHGKAEHAPKLGGMKSAGSKSGGMKGGGRGSQAPQITVTLSLEDAQNLLVALTNAVGAYEKKKKKIQPPKFGK